ncbi:hypothetical protein CK203_092008 [Vitis vinifera]|uniref:Uncharacterized protein n=1 Tax=Vitis vinifera TaxID=29760 RepID=A0A438CWC4_VITVI|nr:hypothetical protein CK203_092008 [Vitis vinifera]
MGGKGGRRLLVPPVQKTFSRLGVGDCDAIYGAHIRLHGGEILTIDVLMRGGWSTTTNKCNFCKISEESTNLTLMHSDRTRKMWESLLAILAAIVGISRFCERGARHGQKMEDIVGDWMV